jgi:hypothetical protein
LKAACQLEVVASRKLLIKIGCQLKIGGQPKSGCWCCQNGLWLWLTVAVAVARKTSKVGPIAVRSSYLSLPMHKIINQIFMYQLGVAILSIHNFQVIKMLLRYTIEP